MVDTHFLEQHFLSPDQSVNDAIERLNAVQPKLLLVTTLHGGLIGTVTDGDIRRALLKHLPLTTPVQHIMNPSPKVLGETGNDASALKIMRRYGLTGVPQLDNEGRVIAILGRQNVVPRRDNAVFLMAGGFGKRLRPLTNNCPKPMLKVGDKPILETILSQFIDAGFHRFFISTHYLNEQIEHYFGDGSQFGVSITYVNESIPLGTAGAIGLLPAWAREQPLLMMNGDLLTRVDFDQLLTYHEKEGADLTMAVREYQTQIPYGVVEHNGSSITRITEKPLINHFINAGIYCISPQAANSVQKGRVLDMPDLIDRRLTKGAKVAMFPVHEYWLDIGRISDFERAQEDIRLLRGVA